MLPETFVTLIWTFEKSWFCGRTPIPSASSTPNINVTRAAGFDSSRFINPPQFAAHCTISANTNLTAQVPFFRRCGSTFGYLDVKNGKAAQVADRVWYSLMETVQRTSREAPANLELARKSAVVASVGKTEHSGKFRDRNCHHCHFSACQF